MLPARLPSFLLCLCLCLAPGLAAAKVPVAVSVRLETKERDQRLIFSLDACVAAEPHVLDHPARAIVDLPETTFLIDPAEGQPQGRRKAAAGGAPSSPSPGLITSWRFGRLAPGKSRVVIDLSRPARIVGANCAPARNGFELAIALAPESDAAFKDAARAAPSPPGAPVAETPAPAPSAKPTIVLDPGHGGVDSGALGRNHAVEKQVVLEFAKTLAARLRQSDRYRVVLTREDDVFVPLGERVRIARKLGAALFVSLHADTLRGGGAEGATVYTVSDKASDREAARVAESENGADANAGLESPADADDVNDMLFDLTRRETRAYSHVFARSLSEYWKVAARLNKNPRRSAGFVVLKAPDVPSVLLELGYLSSATDAADLTSPAWRDKATTQVAHAIDAFFAAPAPALQGDAALKPTQSPGN